MKWPSLALISQDREFIVARQFQLQEIARIYRIPLSRITNANDKS